MKRSAMAIVGIAVLAVAAVFIAKGMLSPAKEEVERTHDVLTHAYLPSLVDCAVMEDGLLPKTLPRPGVDEDLLYVAVTIFYPGVDRTPSPNDHRLERVNGNAGVVLAPIHSTYEVAEDGTYLTLVYKTDYGFEHARMVFGKKPLFDRVVLE